MGNKHTIRIKDIAAKANVSVGTVDRVLHNRGRVSEEVRQKVLRMMEEMNYEPNPIARALGTNRSYRLAAIMPDHARDPYWLSPRQGIEKAAKELAPFGVSIASHVFDPHDAHSFVEQATEATREKPDGILVAPLFYREFLPFFTQWLHQDIPYVLFNTQITEAKPLSYIGQDSYQSGFLAGKLLHYGQSEPGTLLIAHIAEDIANSAHLNQKERGFRDYFIRNGLQNSARPVSHRYKQLQLPNQGYTLISADLPNPADASFARQLDHLLDEQTDVKGIFVTTSKAYEIAPYLQAYHRDDIRLVGYDLLERNIHFLNESIIDFLINQNPHGQGYWGILSLSDHLVFKKEVLPLKYLPLDIITKENLQYYVEAESQ